MSKRLSYMEGEFSDSIQAFFFPKFGLHLAIGSDIEHAFTSSIAQVANKALNIN